MNHWESIFRTEPSKVEQHLELKDIIAIFPEDGFSEMLRRSSHDDDYKNHKFMKKAPSLTTIEAIKHAVSKKYFEYQLTVRDWERAILGAYYYTDLIDNKKYNLETKDSRIFAEKPLIIRILPFLGTSLFY